MILQQDCKESKKLNILFEHYRQKKQFAQNHPDYFIPDGLAVFIGAQGSGKTLSAVNYVYKLMEQFPKCKLVSNLLLRDYPPDGKRVFQFVDNDDFAKYENGEYGIIYLVDEIQLYLNSLESRNINLDVVAQFAQQRKQRKHIVATSQVFGRLAKPLREQFTSIIVCQNYFGMIQVNNLLNRDSIEQSDTSGTSFEGKVSERFVWFHHPDMYERYDTYTVIKRGKWAYGENQKKGVYENGFIGIRGNISSDRK